MVKIKSNSKYCIGDLDKAIRPLVLIMPKMRGYVKIFKIKEGDQKKIRKNNKLMSFCIDDERLLEKYKAIWKIRTYGDKVYTNLRGLNVPEDDVECESFTIIFIYSLHVVKTNIICKYI